MALAFDIASYAIIAALLGALAWLYHRELAKTEERSEAIRKNLERERVALERRISDRTKELIDSEQARTRELERVARLGQLAQGLFHDLINPLSAVSLSIEHLSRHAQAPDAAAETKAVIQSAVAASRRMNSFMESVKTVIGRSEEAAALESPGVCSLSAELAIVQDLLAYKARTAGVELTIARSDPLILRTHPVRIQQLLLNMISNAIEACERARAADPARAAFTVDVSVVRAPFPPGGAEIRVTDDGCGLSYDAQAKAFTDGFSTKAGGTGIGLSTVRSIVEKDLSGSVRLEPMKKHGTLCAVLIPESSCVDALHRA